MKTGTRLGLWISLLAIGGGGSSYVTPSATSVTMATGVNGVDGQVTLSW